jgi:Lamin Tail Domain/CHU_C Type IX secretion signal domain/Bacterial Ig-like domain
MRITLLGLLMLMITSTKSQVLENFNDGNFTSNPAWSGDVTQFIVNTQQQLQLNSSGTDLSYLSSSLVQNSLDSIEWRCYVRLNFSPSSSNYGRIYLVSDQADLEASLNGYYIQLGESLSNDAVELFRQTGSTVTSIARCSDGLIASSFAIGIRVTRSANAEWKIYIDYSGGTNYAFEASGSDATFNTSSYFGIVCGYTSSNATNFYFDDFYSGFIEIDTTPPAIFSATVLSSSTVDLKFTEQIQTSTAQNTLNYSVNQSIGNPLTAVHDATDKSLVHLSFSTNFSPGPIYTLSVNNIADLNSNIIAANSAIQFALPDTARANDIVINEILFNPYTGGVDFVELYNRSSKALDLKELKIANTNDITNTINVSNDITSLAHILLPGEYAVITEDASYIRSTYISAPISSFINIVDLPTYNDDEGGAVLLDKNGNEIDRFLYKDDLQFPLLNDDEGVSLERISPERSADDNSNWHSASASSGFATPGLKNSQFSASTSDGNEITVDPEIFSPDNDGMSDVLNIHYKFDKPGYVASVKIFSSTGRPVIELIKSELLGTEEGVWSWDGINEDNEKAPVGIYVLFIEAFTKDGDSKKIKKTCVLGAKL